MNRLIRFLKGYVRIRLMSRDPERFLNLCARNRILLWQLVNRNGSYEMYLSTADFFRLHTLCRKSGSRVKVLRKYGLPFFFYRNRKRKAFFAGIFLCICLLFALSLFIWNIHVTGNYANSTGSILAFLEQQGISHGILKSRLNCSEIAAMLREEFPNITWVSAKIEGTQLILEIKENVDGSVSFIRVEGTFTNQMVAPYGAKEIFNVVPVDNYEYVNYAVLETVGRDNVYDYNVADMDLNVYLDDEIPVVSWMEAAHVTLRNNTLSNGNYISMNEKNEGILVNEAGEAYYLDMTDTDAVVPSFFISKGFGSDTERMYLYNPIDSISYQVNMQYDPAYMLGKDKIKVIFKVGALNEACDQLTISDKGESRVVADEANADGDVWAGLKRFKFQIVKPSVDADAYYIRQIPEHLTVADGLQAGLNDTDTKYLASQNEVLYLTTVKEDAMEVAIEKTSAPVANESVGEAIEGVSVIAGNGTVTIQGAAGKQVIVSNILGKVVANTVLTSDNATISVPAGIVAVAVEGEEAVKAIVK